jgi:transcriptional regulator with XRE-family HTH domain
MRSSKVRTLLAFNLKRLRAIRKLTGDGLAERAGLSGDYIRRLETCRAWASPETLDVLSKALKAQAHELFLPRK